MNFLLALILNAAYRAPVRTAADAHAGNVATEVEVARIGTTSRTAPIVAVGTNSGEPSIDEAAEARHGQFKGRCKK